MTVYSDCTIIPTTLKYKNSLSLAFLYFKYTSRFAITCFERSRRIIRPLHHAISTLVLINPKVLSSISIVLLVLSR